MPDKIQDTVLNPSLSCLERGTESWSRLLGQNTGVDTHSIQDIFT